ncbi:hypothetical protein AC579_2797 [Pseudocercospora musae]|uniref:Uncharacterized protein n=1 Tax=Pseudocercospora musae TaxID=113226 RepID=A0A139HK40_9PEZI|nr:hypothetical protein AC579_2797 [Pseudocercospora musae]
MPRGLPRSFGASKTGKMQPKHRRFSPASLTSPSQSFKLMSVEVVGKNSVSLDEVEKDAEVEASGATEFMSLTYLRHKR